jgi:hypothetical protein
MITCLSPNLCMSNTARSERPIRREISWLLAAGLPCLISRSVRSLVERGSML